MILISLTLFQTCLIFFLPENTGEISKNVLVALFHTNTGNVKLFFKFQKKMQEKAKMIIKVIHTTRALFSQIT